MGLPYSLVKMVLFLLNPAVAALVFSLPVLALVARYSNRCRQDRAQIELIINYCDLTRLKLKAQFETNQLDSITIESISSYFKLNLIRLKKT